MREAAFAPQADAPMTRMRLGSFMMFSFFYNNTMMFHVVSQNHVFVHRHFFSILRFEK